MLKERGHQSTDALRGSDGRFNRGLNLLMCTVCCDIPIFIVILVGPFSSVAVHGPVHQGSSFPQLEFDSSTCVLYITVCLLSHHVLVVVSQQLRQC